MLKILNIMWFALMCYGVFIIEPVAIFISMFFMIASCYIEEKNDEKR